MANVSKHDRNPNNNPQRRPRRNTCSTCHEAGHAMVTNKKCKYHDEYRAWKATKPAKGVKFPMPIEEGANDDDDGDVQPSFNDDDEDQAARNTAECDIYGQIL